MNKRTNRGRAIETASFLTRSDYRVKVLEALATEPRTRDDLREVTGVPRITLGRVLTAFEQQGWIEREGQRFRTTVSGDTLAHALGSFLADIETIQKLEMVIEWLPSDDLPFELSCLADGEIILPREGDPMAPVRRASEWLVEAERVRVLSPVVISETLESNWSSVIQRGQTFEGVFPTTVIDTIAADTEMATQLCEMIETGQADIYQGDFDIPFVISTTEAVAALPLSDEQGMPRGLIVTDDDAVYTWAEGLIDSYRDRATRIGPDRFRA